MYVRYDDNFWFAKQLTKISRRSTYFWESYSPTRQSDRYTNKLLITAFKNFLQCDPHELKLFPTPTHKHTNQNLSVFRKVIRQCTVCQTKNRTLLLIPIRIITEK